MFSTFPPGAAWASHSHHGVNEELVKGSRWLHAKGWEWNLRITYLSLGDFPKPRRMFLKVEGAVRSSHRSHTPASTVTICLSSLSGDTYLSLLLSCADRNRSRILDCDSVCLFKPLGGFVSSFLFHIYGTINITWFQQDLVASFWSLCRIGSWIISVCGHLLTWSWLMTRPILSSLDCPT